MSSRERRSPVCGDSATLQPGCWMSLTAEKHRSFLTSPSKPRTRDPHGKRLVARPAADVEAATDLTVYALRPKLAGQHRVWQKFELPDWQNKSDLSKTVQAVCPAVWPAVDSALSYQTRVLFDLPTMRNYYAHKAERAARSARGLRTHYGLTRVISPAELLCTPPRGGAIEVLLNEWLSDLTAILRRMP